MIKKYSDSVSRLWFVHEESREVTTPNYTGLWFLLHVMRGEIDKQFILARDCTNRQRPLPTYLATTRAIYQGTEAGQSARGISVRYCVNRQRRSRTCWPTLGIVAGRNTAVSVQTLLKWSCPVVPLAVENCTLMILREYLRPN